MIMTVVWKYHVMSFIFLTIGDAYGESSSARFVSQILRISRRHKWPEGVVSTSNKATPIFGWTERQEWTNGDRRSVVPCAWWSQSRRRPKDFDKNGYSHNSCPYRHWSVELYTMVSIVRLSEEGVYDGLVGVPREVVAKRREQNGKNRVGRVSKWM